MGIVYIAAAAVTWFKFRSIKALAIFVGIVTGITVLSNLAFGVRVPESPLLMLPVGVVAGTIYAAIGAGFVIGAEFVSRRIRAISGDQEAQPPR